MCGIAVANQVRVCGLTNTGPFGGLEAGQPTRLVADGPLAIATRAGGKQVDAGLEPEPVGTRRLQQRRAQGQVAILVALSIDNVNDHALAVDVLDLQPRNLGAANAGTVQNHKQGSPEEA